MPCVKGKEKLDRLDKAHALKNLKSIGEDRHMNRLLTYNESSANDTCMYAEVIWKYMWGSML